MPCVIRELLLAINKAIHKDEFRVALDKGAGFELFAANQCTSELIIDSIDIFLRELLQITSIDVKTFSFFTIKH